MGALLVQCAAEVERDVLLRQWRELVPDPWHAFCDVDLLCCTEGGCRLVAGGRVVFGFGSGGGESRAAAGSAAGQGKTAPVVAGGKRNWHEMFAAQRKR